MVLCMTANMSRAFVTSRCESHVEATPGGADAEIRADLFTLDSKLLERICSDDLASFSHSNELTSVYICSYVSSCHLWSHSSFHERSGRSLAPITGGVLRNPGFGRETFARLDSSDEQQTPGSDPLLAQHPDLPSTAALDERQHRPTGSTSGTSDGADGTRIRPARLTVGQQAATEDVRRGVWGRGKSNKSLY